MPEDTGQGRLLAWSSAHLYLLLALSSATLFAPIRSLTMQTPMVKEGSMGNQNGPEVYNIRDE